MTAAIEVQHLSKRFRLYQEKYTSLKERALHAGRVPFDEFWALRDVDIEVPQGSTLGILGRNGSGKSTLLKCIAGILQPTAGQVVVRGHLAAMLELGAGFHPELSGRDNIYLNGSLLGFSKREIDRRFEAIVAFAELEQFIDNQVKYYSSGMYIRLGFAVAVNTDPDVLIIDEVLAVGDERFQQKCLDRVQEFQREGRTIVVVSHAPDAMRPLCDEILVVDHGNVITLAPPGVAIRQFRDLLIDTAPVAHDAPAAVEAGAGSAGLHRRSIEIGEVSTEYPGYGERPYFETGDPLTITLAFEVREQIAGAHFGLSIWNERAEVIFSDVRDTAIGGGVLDVGTWSISFLLDSVQLLDGRFSVNIDVRDGGGVVLDVKEPACAFEVMNPGRATGLMAIPMRVRAAAARRTLIFGHRNRRHLAGD